MLPPVVVRPGTHPHSQFPTIELSPVIRISRQTNNALDRLFGCTLPHHSLAKLTGFNSTVLTREFKNDVRKLLTRPADSIYEEPETTRQFALLRITEDGASEGNILESWKKSIHHKTPNPHHLIPRSRSGTGSRLNIRMVPRDAHNDFHTVFVNLTPTEQLLHFITLHQTSFQPEFIAAFFQMVSEPDWRYFYVPKAIKTPLSS